MTPKQKVEAGLRYCGCVQLLIFFFFFDVAVDFDNVYNVFFFSYRDMGVGNPYRNGY